MGQFEKLETLLKSYRENKANYQMTLSDFNKYRDQLLLHEKVGGIESADEVIAGMAVGAQKLSDIPRSETNKFHSSTEDVVINYRYYLRPSPLEINAIKGILQEKAQLLQTYEEQINRVDNLLKTLATREKYIIRKMYIEGFNGKQTMLMWNQNYPNCALYSIRYFYSLRDDALSEMNKLLK